MTTEHRSERAIRSGGGGGDNDGGCVLLPSGRCWQRYRRCDAGTHSYGRHIGRCISHRTTAETTMYIGGGSSNSGSTVARQRVDTIPLSPEVPSFSLYPPPPIRQRARLLLQSKRNNPTFRRTLRTNRLRSARAGTAGESTHRLVVWIAAVVAGSCYGDTRHQQFATTMTTTIITTTVLPTWNIIITIHCQISSYTEARATSLIPSIDIMCFS